MEKRLSKDDRNFRIDLLKKLLKLGRKLNHKNESFGRFVGGEIEYLDEEIENVIHLIQDLKLTDDYADVPERYIYWGPGKPKGFWNLNLHDTIRLLLSEEGVIITNTSKRKH
ncbi:hypothetical protein [Paenibacillus sp. MMO-58]|uniref:hypothetical protein n=1 Tax=Paenibacillus sp. MMO-58 TaxID=3081290 RepID=UPI003019AC17